jgi:ribosomal protein S19
MTEMLSRSTTGWWKPGGNHQARSIYTSTYINPAMINQEIEVYDGIWVYEYNL